MEQKLNPKVTGNLSNLAVKLMGIMSSPYFPLNYHFIWTYMSSFLTEIGLTSGPTGSQKISLLGNH